MIMKTDIFIWSVLLTTIGFLSSCDKNAPADQLYWQTFDNIAITCPEANADYFIEGELDGQPFCYQVGVDDHEFFANFPTRTVSIPDPDNPDSSLLVLESGSFEFGIWPKLTTRDHLDHYIRIQSPVFERGLRFGYLWTMHQIENLPIQSSEIFFGKGFKIDLVALAQPTETSGGFYPVHVSSAQGPQDDSFMQVVEAYHLSDGINEYYQFDIAFECDLYYTRGSRDHYGKITNGRMRVAFDL
jgi:hypothetical protein